MSEVGYDPRTSDGDVRMILFAGPNGGRKSSVIKLIQADANFPRLYINADDIARSNFSTSKIRPSAICLRHSVPSNDGTRL